MTIVVNNENITYRVKKNSIQGKIKYTNNGYILWVCVDNEYQGKGIGKKLIYRAVKNLSKKGCVCIQLDDMSDNAWNEKHNIYLKMGFKYVNVKPNPEMRASAKKVIKTYKKLIKLDTGTHSLEKKLKRTQTHDLRIKVS